MGFDHKRMEIAAAAIVSKLQTPVANGLIDRDGYVDWRKADDRSAMLSGGERALIDLARHLSGRQPTLHNSSFIMALSRIDYRLQLLVVAELLDLLDGAELMIGGVR